VQSLFQRGLKEIVLKRGAQGATCFQSCKAPINALAFDVQEVDPTGAGDCFGGAYVACRRMGLPLADVLTYACAAGARNVTKYGPMEGAGTRLQLDAFIQTTKRLDK
jgi:sugar/nucleoside kinase (ribokinase family)